MNPDTSAEMSSAVPPLAPGCPWSGWELPNVNWCEENLCSWVVNPANTWSNLAFLVIAVLMMVRVRGAAAAGNPVRLFGPISIILAVTSGIYHASYTFFFQVFDFAGMFLFLFLPVVINLRRLGRLKESQVLGWYLAGSALFTVLVIPMHYLEIPIQGLVLLLVVVVIGQELYIRLRADDATTRVYWYAALLAIAIAATFSGLDVSRIWCDPSNHLVQGHAIWHLLSATSLYLLFLFYHRLSRTDGAIGDR